MISEGFSPKTKVAVLSLSGGMDSTSLLLNLIFNNYTHIYCLSFDYGQKHKIELEKAEIVVNYLKSKFPEQLLDWKKLDLKFMTELISNSLTDPNKAVPEGFYNNENMKDTVVENRNAIFSSIVFAYALNLAKTLGYPVQIAMGIHKGDHSVYPDCRPEFIESALHTYQIGNWGGELVTNYLPYLYFDKSEILDDAITSCLRFALDFNFIFKNTNTSYAPLADGRSEGKTGSDVERILAFHKVGHKDPFEYTKPWKEVLEYALTQEKNFNRKNEVKYNVIKKALKSEVGKAKIKLALEGPLAKYAEKHNFIETSIYWEGLKNKLKDNSKEELDYDKDIAPVEIDYNHPEVKKFMNPNCNPLTNSWISYPDKVLGCIDYNQVPLFLINDKIETHMIEGIPWEFLFKEIVKCNESNITLRKGNEYPIWVEFRPEGPIIIIARKEDKICRIVDIIRWVPPKNIKVDVKEVFKFIAELSQFINVVEVGSDDFPISLYDVAMLGDRKIKTVQMDLCESHYDVLKHSFYSERIKIFDEVPYLNLNMNEQSIINQILELKVIDSKLEFNRINSNISALCGVVNLVLGNMFKK